jgi:predicted dehydrogenase
MSRRATGTGRVLAMPIRVGLVGLGDAGNQHARALTQLEREGVCRFVAICARDPGHVRAFRNAHALPEETRSFVGFDALLDEGSCDALILATPDPAHTEQLVRCTARGVHVLVEKPLATSLEAGREALQLAHKRDVIVRIGYHLRHHPAHRLVRARDEQLIGQLCNIQMHWAWRDPNVDGWRARGQGRFWALAALGTHCIDLARWFVGAEPTRLAYLIEPATGIDRAAELSLGFPHALVHTSVSVSHSARSRLVLTGEDGEIECLGTLGARGDGEIWVRPRGKPREPLNFVPSDPYVAQLRAFVEAIARGQKLPVDEMLGTLAILDAVASGKTTLA